MSTTIRNELSKKNCYHVEKYRMLELKNFCRQYGYLKNQIKNIDGYKSRWGVVDLTQKVNLSSIQDRLDDILDSNLRRITMIEECAKLCDRIMCKWILIGVTEGVTYDNLRLVHNIPCSREKYYIYYRKFFYILDKMRN